MRDRPPLDCGCAFAGPAAAARSAVGKEAAGSQHGRGDETERAPELLRAPV